MDWIDQLGKQLDISKLDVEADRNKFKNEFSPIWETFEREEDREECEDLVNKLYDDIGQPSDFAEAKIVAAKELAYQRLTEYLGLDNKARAEIKNKGALLYPRCLWPTSLMYRFLFNQDIKEVKNTPQENVERAKRHLNKHPVGSWTLVPTGSAQISLPSGEKEYLIYFVILQNDGDNKFSETRISQFWKRSLWDGKITMAWKIHAPGASHSIRPSLWEVLDLTTADLSKYVNLRAPTGNVSVSSQSAVRQAERLKLRDQAAFKQFLELLDLASKQKRA